MRHLAVLLIVTLCWFESRALAQDAGSAPNDAGSAPSDAGPGPTGAPPAADADAGAPPTSDAPVPSDDPFAAAEAELVEPPATDGGVSIVAPDDSLFQVEGIDIVARADREAVEAPGSVYTVNETELERFNFDDANQVLLRVPGVYVRQEDGYGLRPNIGMRGADADRSKKITLMEDGVLFGPAPYSAPAAYYFPIMTRMVGVEVFKGASAIRYGPQTIGGGLDLRTRSVPTDGKVATIDLAGGNTYFTKLHGYGGYGEKHWGLLAEGVHVSSSGFKELDGGGDTGFGKQELMLKGRLNTNPDARVYQRVEPKIGYAREESNETYLGLSDQDFRKTPLRRYAASRLDGFTSSRTQFELKHVLGVGEHFELDTVVYRHDVSRLWNRLDGLVNDTASPADDSLPGLKDVTDNPTANRQYIDLFRGAVDSDAAGAYLLLAGNRRAFVAQGVQTVAHLDFTSGKLKHEIELGLRVHQDRIRRRHTATGYAMIDGLPVADDVKRPLLARNEVETLAIAAHATYDLTLFDLTLSPGVRTEIIRAKYTERLGADAGDTARFDPNVVLLALGARYAVTDEVALIAGAQQGMTPVAPYLTSKVRMADGSFARPKVDSQGEVERAMNYEAGVRYASASEQASAIGFVSDYDNVVSPCDEACTSDLTGSYASGKALVVGAELGAQGRAKLPRGYGLPAQASYTYTHAEFTEAFESDYPLWGDVKSGDAMPYIPPHQFAVGAGVDYQMKMGLDLSLSFTDRMREQAGQGALQTGTYTDRYAMLDATAFYQLLEHFRLYLKGDNLTNNQPIVSRRPFGARPNKPLLVQIGVKWEL